MLSVSCEACWITHPIPCGLPKEAPPAAVHVPSELYDEGDGEENLEAEKCVEGRRATWIYGLGFVDVDHLSFGRANRAFLGHFLSSTCGSWRRARDSLRWQNHLKEAMRPD